MKDLNSFERIKLFKTKVKSNIIIKPPTKNIFESDENVQFLRKKKHTNFEEMLIAYEDSQFNNIGEEMLIDEFKLVFKFYQEKKRNIEKEMQNGKLFLFRFKKAKELIQIYKIFELLTNSIFIIIEYNKNPNPSRKQRLEYNKIKKRGKKIINFKKKEENSLIKKEPELDAIKLFSEEESNENNTNNSINNTYLNTINDNFEIKKDCHLLKNNAINFIPQIEINFPDNIEITQEMILNLKQELKEIFEDENFSVIEINKGSIHFLISLQFIFKKLFNKLEKIKDFTKKIKNKVSQFISKIKNFDFCFFGIKGKKKKACAVHDFIKDIESSEKEIIQIFKEKVKGEEINEKTNFYEAAKGFSINDFNEVIDYLSEDALARQEYDQLIKIMENIMTSLKEILKNL